MRWRVAGAAALVVAALSVGSLHAQKACVSFPEDATFPVQPDMPLYCEAGDFLAIDVHGLLRTTSDGTRKTLEPIVLRKEVGNTSPALWKLLRDDKAQLVTISLYVVSVNEPELLLQMDLEGARVQAIEPTTPKDLGSTSDLERIRLTYDALTIQYKGGRSTRVDRRGGRKTNP